MFTIFVQYQFVNAQYKPNSNYSGALYEIVKNKNFYRQK